MGGGIDYQLIIFMMKYQDVGSDFFPPVRKSVLGFHVHLQFEPKT